MSLFSMEKGIWQRAAYCGDVIQEDEIYYRNIDDFLNTRMQPVMTATPYPKRCTKCFEAIQKMFFKEKDISS